MEEKILQLFEPAKCLLNECKSEDEIRICCERWGKTECILDGGIKEIFNKLNEEQLGKFFNSLLNDKDAFCSLQMKRLEFHQKDMYALSVDLLLLDESKKKVILTEFKYKSKYNVNQYLKYFRLKIGLEALGYNVTHLLIGKHKDASRNIVHANHIIKEFDKSKKTFSLNPDRIKFEWLNNTWQLVYSKNKAVWNFATMPVYYVSYSDLYDNCENLEFSPLIREDFNYIKENFN